MSFSPLKKICGGRDFQILRGFAVSLWDI